MSQLQLFDLSASPMRIVRRPTPREQGEQAAQLCTTKAVLVSQFDTQKARAFVLGYLAKHGPSWGEDTVDAAKSTGRMDLAAHDGRAWGSVFSSLARNNRIRCLRADGVRRHGHGTAGARQWGLVL